MCGLGLSITFGEPARIKYRALTGVDVTSQTQKFDCRRSGCNVQHNGVTILVDRVHTSRLDSVMGPPLCGCQLAEIDRFHSEVLNANNSALPASFSQHNTTNLLISWNAVVTHAYGDTEYKRLYCSVVTE